MTRQDQLDRISRLCLEYPFLDWDYPMPGDPVLAPTIRGTFSYGDVSFLGGEA